MAPALTPLPVDEALPALLAALRAHPSAVLKAPTGAGKTTRVPPALLDAGLAGQGSVITLEPRRVAARAAARRIASERGARLGDEVGYQIRFDRQASERTRLLIVTEGVLVRMLQDDPFLEGVGALVFDEFHERSLHVDLALAMARRVQHEARPDLKLVVMSATLDPAPIAAWLGGCPVVESQGRLHPVEIHHLPLPSSSPLPELAAEGVVRALSQADGDVLAFLPGVGEIRRAASALEGRVGPGVSVLSLYGDLPPEEQDRVLAPGGGRKVVLATNVAQTSLTIPGVSAVVDTGMAKVARHDPARGVGSLELGWISQASADQRAGRAGRERPGLCLRLWTERQHRLLDPDDEPEVRRVDMAGPALELLAWGEPSLEDFPWYEAPPGAALGHARVLLERLGALGPQGVTALGRQMVRWPLHPRLSRLLIEAHRQGFARHGAWLAALLGERDPFVRDGGGGRAGRGDSDVLERLRAVMAAAGGRHDGRLHPGAVRIVERAAAQLEAIARRVLGPEPAPRRGQDEALGRALLAGWPDRVARRRAEGSELGVMVGGQGVRLAPTSVVRDAALLVCVEVTTGRRDEPESLVRQASAIEGSWLDPALVVQAVELTYDAGLERVTAWRRERYLDMLLSEHPARVDDAHRAAELLAEAALADPERHLGLEGAASGYLARLRALAGWMPELELPTFEGASLAALVLAAAQGRRTMAELARAPWLDLIHGALSWPQRQAVERHAPERLEVPSGSQIRLTYPPDGPPVLAVRIQEVFGLADTPTVADGRVPVLLHLLAPNMRPQQVTRDLRSFWDNTYPEVRKELRQRYPKHAWPEDPWNAPPERKPQRKRS